jgi:alkylation response protein AidB-like acyl-CoA dehydrogenase
MLTAKGRNAMYFSFSEEQEEFRVILRRFLADKSPTSEVRKWMEEESGYDPEVWQRISRDLGLPGVHIPEDYGGQGFGFVELAMVCEEMGRALLPSPFFASTVLAATAILNAASEDEKRELLPDIASGDVIATLAFTEDDGAPGIGAVGTTATAADDGYILNGSKSFVLAGHTAHRIVVLARAPGSNGDEGLSFFLVEGAADGLERRLLTTVDATRKQARLSFSDVKARLLGTEGQAAGPLAKTLDQALVCLANEMVGGAEQLRESALEYAQMRMQFGRTIASFQTMKHKAADMLLEVELAKAAAYYAAAAADHDDAELTAVAALAKAGAAEAYLQTAIHTIQIHGGIGFTWDNDTQLWFKRAKASEVFLGDPTYQRERMIQSWDSQGGSV